jgi:fido (protein-threonine AMPylation protein)
MVHQDMSRYIKALEVCDPGAPESALHRPQTGHYDTIIHAAAALLESLVRIHPFVDGNERVAFALNCDARRIPHAPGRACDLRATQAQASTIN